MKLSKTFKLVLGGIVVAFSMILLFLSNTFFFGNYAFPAAAGMLLVPVIIDLSTRSAWLIYGAVSLMGMFFLPDKEPALLYLLLLGTYPMVKIFADKLKNKLLRIGFKTAFFNILIILCYTVIINLLGLTQVVEEISSYSPLLIIAMLVLGNIAFLLYDFALNNIALFYIKIIRPKVIKAGRRR